MSFAPLIDKIEINYFRSLYQINLNKLGNINVFVGANDAGKSNILKSLNLFFNNNTSFNEGFEFLSDLSVVREQEARSAKGRMSIWIKVHFNNVLGWSSLPDNFWIRKQWNQYDSIPQIDHAPKYINTINISKFLNKVRFFYVPTLRGPSILSEFLALLHDALLYQHEDEINSTTANLVDLGSGLITSNR